MVGCGGRADSGKSDQSQYGDQENRLSAANPARPWQSSGQIGLHLYLRYHGDAEGCRYQQFEVSSVVRVSLISRGIC